MPTRPLSRRASAGAILVALVALTPWLPAQSSSRDVPPADAARLEPSVNLAADEDMAALARAQRVLAARGYTREAARLEAIRAELEAVAQVRSAEERARGLATADLGDRATRVAILELATAGYRAKGSTTNAEALEWFAEIGRAQRDGRAMDVPAIPAGARPDGGTTMDRIIELVLGASAAHESLGNPAAARCCTRLGRWYIERELRRSAEATTAAPGTVADPPAIAADPVEVEVTPADPSAAPAEPAPSNDLERELRDLRQRIEALQRELDGAAARPPARRAR